MRLFIPGWFVLMCALMLMACGPDETSSNIDNDQSSDADQLSTDEMAVTGDELIDNGNTDADEVSNEDLVAKYEMTYIGNKLSFTLLEGEWAYESCYFATIAEIYYNYGLIATIEYEDPARDYGYPEGTNGCDVLGCVDGRWDQSFSITLDQNYPTIKVKLLFGVELNGGSNCSGKEPETVTLTNQ